MTYFPTRRFTFLFVLAIAPGFAAADVTFYDLFKNVQFEQTANDTAPTVATSYDFGVRIFSDTDGEVTSGTVVTPLNDTLDLSPTSSKVVEDYIYGYSSDAELDALYPAGTYNFSITGGTKSGWTGTLDLPETARANEVPYLTGNSFDALMNATAGNSVNVTWNTFTTNNPNSQSLAYETIYFAVFDETLGGTQIGGGYGDKASYLSATIDGSTLIAGHDYRWSLYYDPRFEVRDAGLNGEGTADIGFDSVTSGGFTVAPVPEPASLTALALGGVAVLRRRRR